MCIYIYIHMYPLPFWLKTFLAQVCLNVAPFLSRVVSDSNPSGLFSRSIGASMLSRLVPYFIEICILVAEAWSHSRCR